MAVRVMEGPAYRWNRITSATTTTVKSGTGVLRGVFLDTTVASAITFNDAIGTVMIWPASFAVGCYHGLDILFVGKIEIVTAGASHLTVWYS